MTLDPSLSDEELVQRAQAAGPGDLRAFDALVRRHQAKVTTNCRYLAGSVDDAPDLAQEVFVKAYFAIRRFERRSSFLTWIQRIKANHCINFVKKRQRERTVDMDEAGLEGREGMAVEPTAESNLERMGQRERIRAVLDALSETVRIPLIMRDMDGFSYQEIADHLEIGLSAVKMRIARGREEFRRLYGNPETGSNGDHASAMSSMGEGVRGGEAGG